MNTIPGIPIGDFWVEVAIILAIILVWNWPDKE